MWLAVADLGEAHSLRAHVDLGVFELDDVLLLGEELQVDLLLSVEVFKDLLELELLDEVLDERSTLLLPALRREGPVAIRALN